MTLIQEDIADEVRNAKCWTLIADETTDRAKRELMVVVLRYVTISSDNKVGIHEDPVCLFDAIPAISAQIGDTAANTEIRLSGKKYSKVIY